MSSKFNASVRPKMVNPICVKNLTVADPTEVNGFPRVLVIAAWWIDPTMIPPVAAAQTLLLQYDPINKRWSNPIPAGIHNFRVIVEKLIAADHYDIFLELYSNGVMVDDDSWHDVYIKPRTPFRAPKNQHVYIPGLAYQGLHILS